MKERPILFSAPMVRAILAGRKTQTRRICKPQPDGYWNKATNTFSHVYQAGYMPWWQLGGINHKCPYGSPGDRLWVRETWAIASIYDHLPPSAVCIDLPKGPGRPPTKVKYPATDAINGIRRRPSIHMPRWASRLTLEILNVCTEPLHDITEHDAWSEGCRDSEIPIKHKTAVDWFNFLWQSINGPGSWTRNPWVWVVKFAVV